MSLLCLLTKRSLAPATQLLRSLILLCICVLIPCSALAEEVRLRLIDAINIALENNEDIEESFLRIAAAQADVMASKGAYDLTVFGDSRYGTFPGLREGDYPAGSVANPAHTYFRTDVGLSQRIFTGGTLRTFYTYSAEQRLGLASQGKHFLKSYLTVELSHSLLKGIGDIATQGAIKSALLSVDDSMEGRSLSVSQITLAVIRAYWALAIAQNNLKVGKSVLKMAQEVLRREHVRNKEGISQGVDVERANLAVKQRQYAIVQYERDVKNANDYLLLLLNAPQYTAATQLLPVSPPLKNNVVIPDEQSSLNTALSQRYELKQAAIVLEQLDIEYDINNNHLLPQLDLIVGGTTNSGNDYLRSAESFSDTSSRPSAYVGLTLSFPLQNREARGNLTKTEQLISIAKERLNKTRRSISTEVKGVLYNFTMAKESIPLAKQAYDLSRRVVQGERKRFEMGGINNRDLLASHDAMAREEMNYFTSYINYNVALAEYRFACATMIESYKITLTEKEARILD